MSNFVQARREISRREIRGGEGLESGEDLKEGEKLEVKRT